MANKGTSPSAWTAQLRVKELTGIDLDWTLIPDRSLVAKVQSALLESQRMANEHMLFLWYVLSREDIDPVEFEHVDDRARLFASLSEFEQKRQRSAVATSLKERGVEILSKPLLIKWSPKIEDYDFNKGAFPLSGSHALSQVTVFRDPSRTSRSIYERLSSAGLSYPRYLDFYLELDNCMSTPIPVDEAVAERAAKFFVRQEAYVGNVKTGGTIRESPCFVLFNVDSFKRDDNKSSDERKKIFAKTMYRVFCTPNGLVYHIDTGGR